MYSWTIWTTEIDCSDSLSGCFAHVHGTRLMLLWRHVGHSMYTYLTGTAVTRMYKRKSCDVSLNLETSCCYEKTRQWGISRGQRCIHHSAGSTCCRKIEASPWNSPASFRGRVKNVAKEVEARASIPRSTVYTIAISMYIFISRNICIQNTRAFYHWDVLLWRLCTADELQIKRWTILSSRWTTDGYAIAANLRQVSAHKVHARDTVSTFVLVSQEWMVTATYVWRLYLRCRKHAKFERADVAYGSALSTRREFRIFISHKNSCFPFDSCTSYKRQRW